MSEAGVIGYVPRKIGSSLSWPAAIRPRESARLPWILRYSPVGIGAGLTSYCTANDSVVSPKDQPAS